MKKVWKVASRWSETGDRDSSILDIFRRYNVVFVGKFQDRFRQIEEGDLIAISDGFDVVAMGVAMTTPLQITKMDIVFTNDDRDKFDYADYVLACRVSFTDLDKPVPYRVSTFHGVHERADEFRQIFTDLRKRFEEEQQFEINARSCTLMINEHSLWKDNLIYRVPIYQRPYSWGELEVRKLVTDLLSSFRGQNGKTPMEPVFIGTMQVTDCKSIDEVSKFHEVIDGQQRLSTLILLLKVLKDLNPAIPALKAINLNSRFETRVNGGEQQKYLKEALDSDTKQIFGFTQNPYLKVVPLIVQILEDIEQIEDSDDGDQSPLDMAKFASYIVSRVYFVVIETRASLSKTLKIFDAINTAGMDLNGGDVFKVRYYEYLCKTKKVKEEEFEKISDLYKAIDEKNRPLDEPICSIEEILSLAQHILIARHKLPKVLHDYAADTFFDRFFDTVLRVNSWENYSPATVKNVDVSMPELKSLINVRFEWENQVRSFCAEARCAFALLDWSRYGRYYYLPILFQARFGTDKTQTEHFVIQLTKLLVLFSILNRRAVYEAHNLMHDVHDRLFALTSSDTANDIIDFLHRVSVNKKINIESALMDKTIAENAKEKNLACRLSAMLDEITEGKLKADELHSLLFELNIDIEHIEAVNHKDGKLREEVHAAWGDDLHQIGNLMVLEMEVNRSISNEDYAKVKLPAYAKSKFCTVRRHAKEFTKWDLDSCKKRKKLEVKRLVEYLCS